MKRPCVYCKAPAHVRDYDETAVCEMCTDEALEVARAEEEANTKRQAQTGAQFVGTQRGTRDDYGGKR